MTEMSIHQEDMTIIYMHAPNNRASKHMKQKVREGGKERNRQITTWGHLKDKCESSFRG